MSDDIDIEEHDVLDNPLIRDIFPDISKVKTEPLYIISDEEPEVDGPNDCLDFNHDSVSNADNELLYEPPITINEHEPPITTNEHVYQTKPPNATNEYIFQTKPPIATNEYIFQTKPPINTNEQTFQTKLIIGSKPTPKEETKKTYDLNAFVLLDDWGPALDACSCFCKQCKILFPTENDLDAHKGSAHSLLVAVNYSRNKAVKSTAKENISPPINQRLCNHCNTYFPNDDSLVQHLYELLPLKMFPCGECGLKFHTKNELDDHKELHNVVDAMSIESDHEEISQFVCLVCPICSIVLLQPKSFLKHMKICHRIFDQKLIKRRIPKKCKFCPRPINNLTYHNKHVHRNHLDKYRSKDKSLLQKGSALVGNGSTVADKSSTLAEKGSTLVGKASALAEKGSSLAGKSSMAEKGSLEEKGSNLEPYIKFSGLEGKLIRMPENLTLLPSPVKSKSEMVIVNKIKQTPKRETTSKIQQISIPEATYTIKQMPIPDATLFKCSKCSVHFVSCLQVSNHERKCSKNQERVACKFCSRLFTKRDILRHYIQHKYSKKFVVFTYNSKLFRRVVTKCSDCNAYFEELSLRKHYPLCNKKSVTTNCVQCDIPMMAKNLQHHYHLHKNMKLRSKDFIKLQALPRGGDKKHKIDHNKASKLNRQSSTVDASVSSKSLTRPSKPLILGTKSTKCIKSDGKRNTLYYCQYCDCYLRLPYGHSSCSKTRKKYICKKCGLSLSCSNSFAWHQRHHASAKIQLSDFEFASYKSRKRIDPPIPTYYKCAKKCKVSFDSLHGVTTHDCSKVDSIKCELCGNKYIPELYSLHLSFHHYSTKSPTRTKLVQDEYSEICIQFLCSHCRVVTDSYDGAVEHCQNHLNSNVNNKAEILCQMCNYRVYNADYDRHKMVHLQNSTIRLIQFEYTDLLSEKWKETFSDLPKNEFDKILSKSIYQYAVNFKMQVIQDGEASLTVHQCGKCKRCVDRKQINDHTLLCNQGIIHTSRHCKSCDMYFESDEEVHKHLKMHSTNFNLRIVRYNTKTDDIFNAKLKNNAKTRKFVVYTCSQCTCCLINKAHIKRHTCDLNVQKCKICKLHFINKCNHRVYHSKHPDFGTHNIKIIEFNPPQFKNVSKVEQNAILYKCTCELHFPSLNAFKTHVKICKNRPKQAIESSFCSKCNFLFPTNLLVAHSITHHSDDAVKQFIIKTIDSDPRTDAIDGIDNKCNVIDNSDDDFQTVNDKVINENKYKKNYVRKMYNLYKCSICKLHFVNTGALLKHVVRNCRVQTKSRICNLCGFKFTPSSFKSHKKHHHAKKYRNCKFNIIVKKVVPPIAKNLTKIFKPRKPQQKTKLTNKIQLNSKNNVKKEKQNVYLYKCYQCSVNFFWVSNKYNVVHENCNDIVYDECEICKLKIVKAVLEKHVQYHHAPNVQITVVEMSKNKLTDNIPNKAGPGSRVLYRCEGFGAHFRRFADLVKYVTKTKNTKEICYTCPECRYDFAVNNIQAHIENEHVKRKFQPKDYTVKIYSLQNVLENVKDSIEVESDVENTTEEDSNVKESVEVESDVGNRTEEDSNVVDTTTEEPLDNFNIEEEDNASINLYRCPKCDISFICRKTCHSHAVYWDHSKIMQTIKCELCKSTFSKKSYSLHMAKHHKNGPVHDIEVEEIWKVPGTANAIQSKVYKESLRVQSMAISTTTGDNDLEMADTNRSSNSSKFLVGRLG